jgi:hypothetical protein
MRIGWLVNEHNFGRALSLRNGPHLPTTHDAHVRNSGILLRNAMAAAAMKKIYMGAFCHLSLVFANKRVFSGSVCVTLPEKTLLKTDKGTPSLRPLYDFYHGQKRDRKCQTSVNGFKTK